ncbi:hypothetical protein H3N56_02520 [Cetobacterium sp. 2A]|uniref:hypothetical protein n=1 Tax=Cetobacterium sp. 2A TaxID=2754723 RepID=UPI00163D028E|nr:hypothetical protein [Cetobacterium sp. 2A]MBC2855367.1 hypothetical protein [Cetobacterium sp. 2A]
MKTTIKVRVTNCTVYYNNNEYKPSEILEIEERFFRDDCMEKIITTLSKVEDKTEEQNEVKEIEFPLTVKELKDFSKDRFGIILTKAKKGEVIEEAVDKFNEKGLELEHEVKNYLDQSKSKVDENEENTEGSI